MAQPGDGGLRRVLTAAAARAGGDARSPSRDPGISQGEGNAAPAWSGDGFPAGESLATTRTYKARSCGWAGGVQCGARMGRGWFAARASRPRPHKPIFVEYCTNISCGGLMKQALLWMFVCLTLSGMFSAQTEAAQPAVSHDSSEPMFLPRDTFWGYGQFDLAPPHNEIDPNICRADAGISGGVNDPCNAFARYMISGYVEAQSLWARRSSAGSSCLESLDFCLARIFRRRFIPGRWMRSGWRTRGAGGFIWAKGFEMRVTQHFLFTRFGARDRNLGPADLGPNGPWGRYNTVGVRKYFGTRRY